MSMVSPVKVSGTIQEFLGERYYLCEGRYFQRNGVRLHREVWRKNFGEIPAGFHIHHVDHDKSNNSPLNLALMTIKAHLTLHSEDREPSEFTDDARKKAAEWHKSEEGSDWHKEQYQKTKDRLHEKKNLHKCKECGKDVWSNKIEKISFCSKLCKSNHRRKSGVDNESRVCTVCGGSFSVNKYAKTQTCGKTCSSTLAYSKRKFEASGISI